MWILKNRFISFLLSLGPLSDNDNINREIIPTSGAHVVLKAAISIENALPTFYGPLDCSFSNNTSQVIESLWLTKYEKYTLKINVGSWRGGWILC